MPKTSVLNSLEAIIETAEKCRNAYFWSAPSSASARRYMERENSIPEITWRDGKDTYTAEYVVSCSCHNVYAKGIYTRNGNKTTLTAIKNSYNRMLKKEEESHEEHNTIPA